MFLGFERDFQKVWRNRKHKTKMCGKCFVSVCLVLLLSLTVSSNFFNYFFKAVPDLKMSKKVAAIKYYNFRYQIIYCNTCLGNTLIKQ